MKLPCKNEAVGTGIAILVRQGFSEIHCVYKTFVIVHHFKTPVSKMSGTEGGCFNEPLMFVYQIFIDLFGRHCGGHLG